jgi:predicted metal-binding membrane protein
MAASSSLESVLRRDRLIVLTALATVIVACWAYVFDCAGMGMATFERNALIRGPGDTDDDMPGMAMGEDAADGISDMAIAMMAPIAWTAGYAVLMFLTWWIMMMAMMLPSAAPMVLLFAIINRKQRDKGVPYVPTGIFAAGYLLVWGAFSLVAVSAQWGLERSVFLSSMMTSTSVLLGAGLLIAAGVYQLTPLKHACLRHCRSPFAFITQHWRPGDLGALRMGIEHGAFCTGCCWFLLALLFYGGIMNLYWMVGLAAYVLLEKHPGRSLAWPHRGRAADRLGRRALAGGGALKAGRRAASPGRVLPGGGT